jgi:hypothetical protein
MVLTLPVLIGALLTPPAVQSLEQRDPCAGVRASVRASPTSFRRGANPTFFLVVRNSSPKAVRLLDIRNGRRPDLAVNYYALVLERNRQELKNVPRVISDPGPIASADFFVLSPAAHFEVPLSTNLDLTALAAGRYSAYVRITLDPFAAAPKCSSSATSFTVTK